MIRKIVTAVMVGGLFVAGQVGVLKAADYAHEFTDKNMTFSWTVDGENLAVKIAAKTTGWVGIGFNAEEEMKGANFVLGYVKDGKVKVTDEFGTSYTSHSTDEKLGGTSDVTVVGGTEEGGMTSVEFTIPLNSGDAQDKVIDPAGETIVLLAYGSGRDSFRSKHKFRGEYSVNLTSGAWKKF